MYARRPAACDDAAGRKAYGLWRDAQAAEAAGDAAAAVGLYRRAARACPTLAAASGFG